MIDRKTRNEIIKLWRAGESKASIGRKTKISQPTIRRIIEEAEMENEGRNLITDQAHMREGMLEERLAKIEEMIDSLSRSMISKDRRAAFHDASMRPVDAFIINLEWNYPVGTNDPWTVMRNGIAYWALPEFLNRVLDRHVVQIILNQIDNLGGRGKVYEVTIAPGSHGFKKIVVHSIVRAQ